MDTKVFKQLVRRAQKDPAFFHALVFDADKALSQFPKIDEKARTVLLAIDPTIFIATLIGETRACGGSETCSCTSGTCDGTCGGSTCSVTCSGDSCGRTCDNSCGYTTNFQDIDWVDYIDNIMPRYGDNAFLDVVPDVMQRSNKLH